MELSVYICEDNDRWRKEMRRMVGDYIAITDRPIECALVTENPLELLEAVKSDSSGNNLYILDVDLGHQINGIELAKEIRELDSVGKIIFVTTHAELSYLTFRHKVEAMDYIIKDSLKSVKKQIEDCLEATYEFFGKATKKKETFQVKSASGIMIIPVSEILYFESHHKSHKLILHTLKKRYEFRGVMREILAGSDRFIQCHKAYIVNQDNVVSVTRIGGTGEAEMRNGVIVPVSRKYLVNLKKALSKNRANITDPQQVLSVSER